MKPACLLAAALFLPSLALADTAYQALRTVGAKSGQAALNQVISVQGIGGTPTPETWKVLLDDPQARAGVRELQVSHGVVIGERTPTRAAGGGSAMDFRKLNLDSDSAFSVANKEAAKAQVGFDSADFQLDGSSSGGAPVWIVTLRDGSKNTAGVLRISANDGAVLSRDWNGAALASDDAQYVRSGPNDGAPLDDGDRAPVRGRVVSEGGTLGDKMKTFGSKVKRHFMRDGAHLEHFFTGGDTLRQKQEEDEYLPPSR